MGSRYQKFSVHGSWEGKLGRVGVWEHGNGLGSGGRVRPRSPAGNVGSWTKLDFGAVAVSGPVVEGKGTASRLPKILCSNLMLVQSRSVHRL